MKFFIAAPMSSLNVPSKLLVIARSARMLAQMAVNAGFVPVAIDCYADSDTRQLTLDLFKVPTLALADIRRAVEVMRQAHGLTHLVYGSGFEQCLEALAFLEQDWIVLGNSADVFRRFQNKRDFFEQLAALSIPHPETVFTPPEDDVGNWLIKPVQGEGGIEIARYEPDVFSKSGECYWQRYQEGEPCSVLFVASRGKVKVLGFNRQWTTAIDDDHPFVFAGVASQAGVSLANQIRLAEWLAKLVEIYSLRGLGSLDFIVADDCCYVLEINARIPASAQLYGKRPLALHLQACQGVLDGDAPVDQASPAAYRIIYARKSLRIPAFLAWPDWSVDRPDGGAIIGKGQPICSIIAAGKSPRQVSEHLSRRQQIIENILNTGS